MNQFLRSKLNCCPEKGARLPAMWLVFALLAASCSAEQPPTKPSAGESNETLAKNQSSAAVPPLVEAKPPPSEVKASNERLASTDLSSSRLLPTPAETIPTIKFALDGEGLRVISVPSGSTRALSFGTAMEQVISTLESVRGASSRSVAAECGLRYASWGDGLSVNFRGQRFVGWSLNGNSKSAMKTMIGIGPGSSRRALEEAYVAKVSQSTLGTEFTAGGMAGLLTGAKPDSQITTMWAGETCVAR